MDLVERDDALATLERALRAAESGSGRVVLVSGEAGIGKTALVSTFVERFAGSNRVLWGVCDDLSVPRPFGPLHDVAAGAGDALGSALREGGARDMVFDLVRAELDRGTPATVLVLEDLHWADEATLDLLTFVCRRMERQPALLVLTYRSDDLPPGHPLPVVIGRVPREVVVRIPLSPLSRAAAQRLTGDRTGRLHALTGGNPFFLTELIGARGHDLPPSVKDAVLARLHRLPPPAQALLRLVSVVPGRTETWLLDTCIPHWEGDAVEPERVGLVALDGGALRFRHELAQHAVVADLPMAQTRQLHGEVLAALVGHGADPARVVHHAAGAGDKARLLDAGIEAARLAAAAGSHREAAAHYRRLVPLLGRLPPDQQAEVQERRSEECFTADFLEEALDAARGALRLRHRLGDVPGRARAHLLIAGPLNGMGHMSECAGAIDSAVRLLETLPPGDKLAEALTLRAGVAMTAYEFTSAMRWADEAIHTAAHHGSSRSLAYAMVIGGAARMMHDEEGGADLVRRGIAMARESGAHDIATIGWSNLAEDAVERYRHVEAAAVLDEAIPYADEHEVLSVLAFLRSVRSRLDLHRGAWDEAEQTANDVLERSATSLVNSANAWYVLARLRTRRGDDGARSTVDRVVADAEQVGELQRVGPAYVARAEWSWLHGDVTTEREALEALTRDTAEIGVAWLTSEAARWARRAGGLPTVPSIVGGPARLELEERWVEAAAAWHALGCPYEQADALSCSTNPEHLAEALGLLDALGANAAADRVRRRMRELGVRAVPRGPTAETRANPAGLTPRQLDVLRLLADGLTNPEIADRLVVSVRTIDHHVAAILTKLGVSSRREAAVAARLVGAID